MISNTSIQIKQYGKKSLLFEFISLCFELYYRQLLVKNSYDLFIVDWETSY